MRKDRIYILLQKLFNREITPDEKEELALWVDAFPDEKEWTQRLHKIWEDYTPDTDMNEQRAEEILKEVVHRKKLQSPPIPSLHARVGSGLMKWSVVAAAAVAALIILSIIYIVPRPDMQKDMATQNQPAQKQEIIPGSNKAVLTLANGQKIVLDSIGNGTLTKQGYPQIIKINNGLLSYKAQSTKHKAQSTNPEYNTISTPKGGQYKVILPDGSKIWLNAASSLRFLTAFTGKERRIEVKGEVYAEIAKDAHKPFIVHVLSSTGKNKGIIKVLGTNFNVEAYDEANTRITLLDGAVQVSQSAHQDAKRLNPGEQALVADGHLRVRQEDHLDRVIAWKNGRFDFEENDIQQVMQQIARWYDVDIKYERMPTAHFMGIISRSAEVHEVLKMLEMTGAVHFKIEGRTIVVSKG